MAYKPCKHLDVPEGRRITKNDCFPCKWPYPKITLPISITRPIGRFFRSCDTHPRVHVDKDDCARCPCFESRKDPSGGGNQ